MEEKECKHTYEQTPVDPFGKICIKCGYVKPKEKSNCEHEWHKDYNRTIPICRKCHKYKFDKTPEGIK